MSPDSTHVGIACALVGDISESYWVRLLAQVVKESKLRWHNFFLSSFLPQMQTQC